MPLLINLRHLEVHEVRLQGEMPVADLDLGTRDELIHPNHPLKYDIEVQQLEGSLLARGRLELPLDCECSRCLKPFTLPFALEDWTVHLPLAGEEQAPVVNDCVDLTPYLREDILLDFPQHPLCNAECGGLPNTFIGEAKKPGSLNPTENGSSVWSELNKLKF
jgi:uncharacterized protein